MSSLPPKNVSPLWAPFNHRCTEQLVELIVEDLELPEVNVGLAAIAAAIPGLVCPIPFSSLTFPSLIRLYPELGA
jgi:hypothetical protein